MKYKFITLGCKVNSYESAAMSEDFDIDGYIHVEEKEKADIVVINTCSVTSVADAKSRKAIRREIKDNPKAIICVVGCYAQLEANYIASIPGVAIVIGTKNRNRLSEYVKRYLKTKTQIIEIDEKILFNYHYEDINVTSYYENTRAYLKIQDGCNNFCSFCIIPYTRGPMRSRPAKDVIKEAETLVKNGYKEIVLTGIHTGGYGEDLDKYKFSNLLSDLCKIEGLERLRISSIEEGEVDDDVINVIQECPKIVNHLHIPLQSGSDSVLKRMNRKYNTSQFFEKITKIREIFPNIAITSDLIVGYPGESEEEFQATLMFLEKIKFAGVHVFNYSIRPGTPAAYKKEQLHGNIKKARVHETIKLTKNHALEYARMFLNKIVNVLFEEYDQNKKTASGHTTNYLKVICHDIDENVSNKIIPVRITKVDEDINYGIIIKKEVD